MDKSEVDEKAPETPKELQGAIRFDTGEIVESDKIKMKVVMANAPDLKLRLVAKGKRFSRDMQGKMILLKGLAFIVREVTKRHILVRFINASLDNPETEDNIDDSPGAETS